MPAIDAYARIVTDVGVVLIAVALVWILARLRAKE